jgi:hypothetical protein
LTGASTITTGIPSRLAWRRLPLTPSQFTGLMKIAAAPCRIRSDTSFFCLRLFHWASSVTSRSPFASMTSRNPSFKSTKNGLFMVWKDTPNRRPSVSDSVPTWSLASQPKTIKTSATVTRRRYISERLCFT